MYKEIIKKESYKNRERKLYTEIKRKIDKEGKRWRKKDV